MYEIYGGNHCYVIFIYAYITATQVRLAYIKITFLYLSNVNFSYIALKYL